MAALATALRNWRTGFTGPAARGGVLSVLDQGILMGANFATSVLIARYCAEEAFGAYVLALSVFNLTTQVQGGLVTGPMTVIAAQEQGAGLKRYLTASLAVQTVLGLLCSAAVAAAGYAAFRRGPADAETGGAMLALALGLWAVQGKMFFRTVFYSRLRAGRALFVDTLAAAVQLGAVVWLLLAGRLSAVTACYALGAAGLTGLAAGLVLSLGELTPDLSGIGAAIKEDWRLGRWMLGTNLALWLIAPVLPWFLKATGGEADVAQWGAAINIVNLSGPFLGGFGQLATPRFAGGYAAGGAAELRRLVGKGTLVIAMGMVGFLAIIALFGEWAAGLLYAHKFPGIGRLATMISGAQLVAVLGTPATAGLVAIRRPALSFAGYAAQAGVTVALGWALCRAWGPAGGAGVMLAAGGVGSAIRAGIFSHVNSTSASPT